MTDRAAQRIGSFLATTLGSILAFGSRMFPVRAVSVAWEEIGIPFADTQHAVLFTLWRVVLPAHPSHHAFVRADGYGDETHVRKGAALKSTRGLFPLAKKNIVLSSFFFSFLFLISLSPFPDLPIFGLGDVRRVR